PRQVLREARRPQDQPRLAGARHGVDATRMDRPATRSAWKMDHRVAVSKPTERDGFSSVRPQLSVDDEVCLRCLAFRFPLREEPVSARCELCPDPVADTWRPAEVDGRVACDRPDRPAARVELDAGASIGQAAPAKT